MSLNKNLYSYHHKKYEAISSFKVCKKKQNEFINLNEHLLVEQRPLYKNFKRIMLHFRVVILMSLNKKFEAISFFKFVKKDKMYSLIYMYIY